MTAGPIEENYTKITGLLFIYTLQLLMIQDKYVFIEIFAMKWVRSNVINEGTGARRKLEKPTVHHVN